MIEVVITKEILERAEARASKLGSLNSSALRGFGNVYGFLGEEIVSDRYKDLASVNNYDYDFEFNGETVDVKTRIANTRPQPHHACGIVEASLHQNVKWLIFCRVMKDKSKGYIVGKITKKKFLDKCIFIKGGDKDPDGKIMKGNLYWLRISELDKCK